MRHRPGVLVAMALSGATVVVGCDRGAPAELTFRVPVERMPQSMRSARDSIVRGDSVEIRLRGEWFEVPLELSVIPRDSADLSSPLTASEASYSAFKQQDADWILASFAEGDSADIQGLLDDPDVRLMNRQYYEELRAKRIDGWVRYDRDSTDYRLVFVRLLHSSSATRVETFVREHDEWRRTNRLASDSVFLMAWRAYRSGTITRK